MVMIYFLCALKLKLWLGSHPVSKFFYAMTPQTLFSNNNIHSRYLFVMIKHVLCDGVIIIIWSLKVFVNDFPLPCQRAKNIFFK